MLNPPAEVEGEAERKETEEGEDLVPKTPEPKEWVGQGSDLEILDGDVKPGRALLKYTCLTSGTTLVLLAPSQSTVRRTK